MNRRESCEWIVCEQGDRWGAALRVMLARQMGATNPDPAGEPRVYEVCSLAELEARLEVRPDALGLISVEVSNLRPTLTWLAAADAHFPQARFIALVDCGDFAAECRQEIVDVLLESGCADVAHSPRHLQHLLPVARRHALAARARQAASADNNTSLASDWPVLPWQAEDQTVG